MKKIGIFLYEMEKNGNNFVYNGQKRGEKCSLDGKLDDIS